MYIYVGCWFTCWDSNNDMLGFVIEASCHWISTKISAKKNNPHIELPLDGSKTRQIVSYNNVTCFARLLKKKKSYLTCQRYHLHERKSELMAAVTTLLKDTLKMCFLLRKRALAVQKRVKQNCGSFTAHFFVTGFPPGLRCLWETYSVWQSQDNLYVLKNVNLSSVCVRVCTLAICFAHTSLAHCPPWDTGRRKESADDTEVNFSQTYLLGQLPPRWGIWDVGWLSGTKCRRCVLHRNFGRLRGDKPTRRLEYWLCFAALRDQS